MLKKILSYTNIYKSEIRNYDRRSCTIDHLFYMFKRLSTERISNAIGISMRKKIDLQAKDILNSQLLENLIQHDDGYRFLKAERNSPVYWEDQKKRIMAMTRQKGCAHIYLTLSAAETKWKPLLKSLLKSVKKINNASDEMIDNLEYAEKIELIKADPVTCARYFDHRVRSLFILMKKNYVFKSHYIIDYYNIPYFFNYSILLIEDKN